MTTESAASTLRDRRQRAADLLNGLAPADLDGRIAALRDLAAQCLGLSPVTRPNIAVKNDSLPDTATVIAEMTNPFGPDVIAVYLDLSSVTADTSGNRVANAQAQAANAAVQQHIGEERTPLLIFTPPDGSGIQFIYGTPTPGSRNRLTAVNRLTYRWGEYNRTTLDALEQIGQAIANSQPPQIALADGFNVQPVTDDFFRRYKAAYDSTVEELKTNLEPGDAEAATQTLFNRLLFVHFVSKKGWLTFNGRRDYLNALWADYQANQPRTNFYDQRLAPLFHGGMNTPERERAPGIENIIGQVPYLNGGLFERNELDRQGVVISDHAIGELLAHDQLFNRYNFTVTEATPLDTEVAVDPEMLGKLFEETVNERHSNGAYYTPRPVVAFMCREALKGYLAGRNIPGLSDDKIADLVDNRNAAAITTQQAIGISEAVNDAKILDPACGSGAFLLGMMQEIIALNDSLSAPEILYQQKLNIISRNLHGADKDANAVSIAMLRLWLSLAVDYDGPGTPPTLPNLELKLAVGDALAGPDPQQAQGDFMAETVRQSRLGELAQAYGGVKSPAVKERLREYIDGVKESIRAQYRDAAPQGVVEWRVDFADVNQAGGFDIVIANPPYVRNEDIKPPEYKQSLLTAYPEAAVGRSDLYCYFYARGLQLLKPGGMHVFVCSNSWLDVGYGAKLQEYLLDNATVDAIYESAVERQFATADINTIISIIRKTAGVHADATRFVQLRAAFETALADAGQRREIVKNRAELRAAATSGRRFVGDKWGGKYLRAPDIYRYILNNYSNKLARLGEIATVRRGITTGANEFFYLTADTITEWGIEPQYLQPVMTTPQESRSLAVNPATLPHLLFTCHRDKSELAGTKALAYIQWGEKQNYHRRSSLSAKPRWYDLGSNLDTKLAFACRVDTTSRTMIAGQGLCFDKAFYKIDSQVAPLPQLCASLNSTLTQLMINIEGRSNFGGGLLEIEVYETQNLPVINPEHLPEVNPTVFNAADWDVLTPSAARRHIDDAVYDALGLTAGERDGVYEGVRELVGNRLKRAQNVPGSRNAAASARGKPRFEVVPLVSGYAPGVTDENLKDILYEMDVEEYLAKERSSRESDR